MNTSPTKWDDLTPRILTGAVLLVVGVSMIWLGGIWFALLAAGVGGAMIWELSRMIAPARPSEALQAGMIAAAAVLLARVLPPAMVVPLLAAAVITGLVRLPGQRVMFAVAAAGILLASHGLISFRDDHGMLWLVWLVLVVVVTDISGYFGGKAIGGRKFWPSVSPKKTWAGIVSGWVAAGIVGTVFAFLTTAGFDLVWITMLVSFASQLGDIGESAVKRRTGVKDSSKLLPGHGGVWDRFDALLGAALLMLLLAQIFPVPEIARPGSPTIPAFGG